MNNWKRIEDELPPMDTPVWLEDPELKSPIMGERVYESSEWYWSLCYGMPYLWHGKWTCDKSEMDDLNPVRWQPLPEPSCKEIK